MTPPINIDGTQITGASIDGQDVSAITVDGTQVFSANEVVDNFESYQNNESLSDNYVGDVGAFTAASSPTFAGAGSLESTDKTSAKGILSRQGDGLNFYPQRGNTVEFFLRHDSTDAETRSFFLVEDSSFNIFVPTTAYGVNVSYPNNSIQLRKRSSSVGGGISLDSTTPPSRPTNEFIKVTFEFGSPTIKLTVEKQDGTVLADLQADDSDINGRGVQLGSNHDASPVDAYWDEILATNL